VNGASVRAPVRRRAESANSRTKRSRRRSASGTTALVFEPLELLERLAAIIPKPLINLLIYHGVLAPNSHWRSHAVAYVRPDDSAESGRRGDIASPESADNDGSSNRDDAPDPPPFSPRNYTWAELMRRTFGYDVMACLECGGRMRLIAMIDRPAVIAKILEHLGLPTETPTAQPARPPPEQLELPLHPGYKIRRKKDGCAKKGGALGPRRKAFPPREHRLSRRGVHLRGFS
jgi:hypothetical protein